jgi:hypothetical protein
MAILSNDPGRLPEKGIQGEGIAAEGAGIFFRRFNVPVTALSRFERGHIGAQHAMQHPDFFRTLISG